VAPLYGWAMKGTTVAFYAGILLVPAFGVTLLLHGRRERRLGRQAGEARVLLTGLAAYFAAWCGVLILVGHKPPDATGVLSILGIDACLLAAFFLTSRRRNPRSA
jgi:hypothetical protein